MKAKMFFLVCVGVVALVAVLSAQGTSGLNAEYQTRAAALKPDDAPGHFELAMWCFEKELYDEMNAEADKLLDLDSGDTRAKYLKAVADFYVSGGFRPGTETTGGIGRESGPTRERGETSAPQPRASAFVADLTEEEIETFYSQYDQEAIGRFRRVFRTVLARDCATNECHGNKSTSGAFYLQTRNATNKENLAENFMAVDRYVERMRPDESPLLRMALAPAERHPGGPVYSSENDRRYVQLKQWVESLPGIWD